MRTFTTAHTVYNFDELSNDAKEKAIEDHRQFEYETMDNWMEDAMYEELKALLKKYKMKCGDATVYYSLSWSQGDGAMFTGDVSYKGYTFTVTHDGNYYHCNSKQITDITRNNGNEISDATWSKMFMDFESRYTELCKELERIGYELIDGATNDEALIDNIKANEYEFYEDGRIA